MSAAARSPAVIVLVGLSHHTAPVEVREQVVLSGAHRAEALRALVRPPVIHEAAILSTCNRVEVLASVEDRDVGVDRITEFLTRQAASADLTGRLYVLHDRDAVNHLFRVAASLDSMVVGEAQILGQLKDHYREAVEAGTSGAVLHRCFHKSFSVAKRVRRETGIARRAVSVSSAAVALARQIFDRLEDKTAMLIGAGQMSELAARHLLSHGVGTLIVANRTFDRAVELAREFQGTPVPFEALPRYLPLADVVIGSAGGDAALLDADRVRRVMHERHHRPMFLIDMGVPRNFDPHVNEIDGVYLYNIDDLEGVVSDNYDARTREAVRAEAIVRDEVGRFWQWFESLASVPTITALRDKFEGLRRRELARVLGDESALTPEQRERVEYLTVSLVNKLLHGPVTRLRGRLSRGEESLYVEATRRLFGLGQEEDDEGEEPQE